MTHTKAPWKLKERETEPCQLIGNGTVHIADIYATDFPAARADALLIAAAPDLLHALENAVSALQCSQDQNPLNESAVDSGLRAIAKAKGQWWTPWQ